MTSCGGKSSSISSEGGIVTVHCGDTLKLPECFPWCDVPDPSVQTKFQPCFPFCHLTSPPVNQNQEISVSSLPSCYPNCAPSSSSSSPVLTSSNNFPPCFPFCGVDINFNQNVFPPCFPFCGVQRINRK